MHKHRSAIVQCGLNELVGISEVVRMRKEVLIGIVVKFDLDMSVLFEMARFVQIEIQGRDNMANPVLFEQVLPLVKCVQAANVQVSCARHFIDPSHREMTAEVEE